MDELFETYGDGVAVGVYDETLDTYRRYDINISPSEASLLIQQNYGVGTSNLDIFDRIAAKLPLSKSYVYYRDSQYVYSFVYGDLSLHGTVFSSQSPVTRIDYNLYAGSSRQPSFNISFPSTFSLNVGDYLVYSNLGDYPMLGGAEGVYRFQILEISLFGFLSVFIILFGFARKRLGC